MTPDDYLGNGAHAVYQETTRVQENLTYVGSRADGVD